MNLLRSLFTKKLLILLFVVMSLTTILSACDMEFDPDDPFDREDETVYGGYLVYSYLDNAIDENELAGRPRINYAEGGVTAATSINVAENKEITFTVIENYGYEFVGWYLHEGDVNALLSNETSYVVTTEGGTHQIYAHFNQLTLYDVTFHMANLADNIVKTVHENTLIYSQLPTPPTKQDHTFDGWYDGAGALVDENTIIVQNVTFFARYTANVNYMVIVESDANGYVKAHYLSENTDQYDTYVYQDQSFATIEAVANVGYEFNGWYADDTYSILIDTNSAYQFTVGETRTYYGRFVEIAGVNIVSVRSYTGASYSDQGGTVRFLGSTNSDGYEGTTYYNAETFTILANPKAGYDFVGWYLDPELTMLETTEQTYTTDVSEDTDYYASFMPREQIITVSGYTEGVSSSVGGYVYINNSGNTDEVDVLNSFTGALVDLVAVAAEGYQFDGWFVGATSGLLLNSGSTYSVTVGTTDMQFYARFSVAP